MKFKCPDCRSTNVSRNGIICTCQKCGEKWELSIKEIELLVKKDKKLSTLERRQLQGAAEYLNDTKGIRGIKATAPDFSNPTIVELYRTLQNATLSMLKAQGVKINKTNEKSAAPAKEESIKAAPVTVKTDEPQPSMKFKCSKCGSTNIKTNGALYLCNNCGTLLRKKASQSAAPAPKTDEPQRNTETIKQTAPDTTSGKSAAPVKTDEPRLITCRICKKDVSSEAASCPHCGDPYITEEKKQAAEKAKRESERSKKLDYIYQSYNEFCSRENYGSCPACDVSKRWEFSDYNESGFYYRDCKCTMNDIVEAICKARYGVTMNEL